MSSMWDESRMEISACPKCARPLRRELGVVVVSVAGAFAFANTLGASAVIPAYAVSLLFRWRWR